MSIVTSLIDCVTESLYACVQIEPERGGTRTVGGLPAVSCPVAPGPLSIPQDDGSCPSRGARDISRAISRCLFQYREPPGFDMPMSTTFGAYLAAPIVQGIGQGVAQARARRNESAGKAFAGDRARFNTFDAFRKLIIEYPVPAIADCWRQDRAWCDQVLAGFDPISIRRVTNDGRGIGSDWTELSAKLNPGVIEAVKRAMDGDTGSAIAAGHLFVADYEELKDAGQTPAAVGAQSGSVPMAPIALFVRSRDHDGLEPVAIQLDQTPKAAYSLPDDSSDWMVARSYAQAASYQLTQIVYHLTLHHLIEEAFAVATMRQLPGCHPLYALLGHHFAGLMPVNTGTLSQFFGEATQQYLLVGREGGENLANARYARWRFEQLDFRADLVRRGVDDPALLPYYPHRDDLLLYWDLLFDYTRDYLALYYGDPRESRRQADRNVAEDFELQAWAAELSREGGGRGSVPGFPDRITTFDALHEIVHLLIFTAGPHHASLNFSQLDYASFVPNMPAATYILPPAGGANEAALLNLMPPAPEAVGQTTMSFQADYYMGQLLDYADYFCGCWNSEAQEVIEYYRSKLLGEVTRTIHKRNRERVRHGSLPYTYVLPVNVPNSISS
ncbi:MAG TPA: lipoxygenase family protein [Thermoanaerobaculia bacterium]|nr:lipoxygenase family protein [Thermoanaerobaculia bacterium]